jgi:hypothetical protein
LQSRDLAEEIFSFLNSSYCEDHGFPTPLAESNRGGFFQDSVSSQEDLCPLSFSINFGFLIAKLLANNDSVFFKIRNRSKVSGFIPKVFIVFPHYNLSPLSQKD